MPYISQHARDWMQPVVDTMNSRSPCTPGELNYLITKLLLMQPRDVFDDYAVLLGTLDAVRLEFARRALFPYEDTKIEANGDIYPEGVIDE